MIPTDNSGVRNDTLNYIDAVGKKQGKWEGVTIMTFFGVPAYDEYYSVGAYRDDKKEGLWRYYSFYGGQLMYEIGYQKGIENGYLKIYNTKGICTLLYEYQNGKRNGLYEEYFNNGTLNIKGRMKDGGLTGEYFKYNRRGKLVKHIDDVSQTSPYGRFSWWFF